LFIFVYAIFTFIPASAAELRFEFERAVAYAIIYLFEMLVESELYVSAKEMPALMSASEYLSCFELPRGAMMRCCRQRHCCRAMSAPARCVSERHESAAAQLLPLCCCRH